MTVTEKARMFCICAHQAVNQKRKYTGEEYYYHPIEVADILKKLGCSDEVVAAGYLHDVLEDTAIDLVMIARFFGLTIASFVEWVTDTTTLADGNRQTRKAIEAERLAKAPAEAQTIKLADLLSNTQSIVKHDPKFAKVYLKEKKFLLSVMKKGNRELHLRCTEAVEENR